MSQEEVAEEEAEEEVRRRSCKGTEIVKLYARSEVLQAEDSGNYLDMTVYTCI